jgi:putative addiction module antidote
MADKTKIRKIGGSLGVILPKAAYDAIEVRENDEVYVVATQDGILITPYDPDFADTLEDAREFMRTHRDAFKELAK